MDFSLSFVVDQRTKLLSFEKFINIYVFDEIIPFLSHLCHLFALHAISAVHKLLTLSYKLSASLQDLFYPLYLEPISRSLLYCHKIVFSWWCFSFPSVLNLTLPTEEDGWCMFLFLTIFLLWMSKAPALSVLIFNVWPSSVVLVGSVYLLFNMVFQPEGCQGTINCHHLTQRQEFSSAVAWLLTRFQQCLIRFKQALLCLLQLNHIRYTSESGQVNA